MQGRPKLELTEADGYEALRAHLVERARAARARHGPWDDPAAVERLLADPEVVRFATRLRFDASGLLDGEFAWARPRGTGPRDGFDLLVHPRFDGRPEALAALVAYHVPSINYLDVATRVEAELFGATLLGMDVDAYYERVCALADELPGTATAHAGAVDPSFYDPTHPGFGREAPARAGGCGSGSCGCDGAGAAS